MSESQSISFLLIPVRVEMLRICLHFVLLFSFTFTTQGHSWSTIKRTITAVVLTFSEFENKNLYQIVNLDPCLWDHSLFFTITPSNLFLFLKDKAKEILTPSSWCLGHFPRLDGPRENQSDVSSWDKRRSFPPKDNWVPACESWRIGYLRGQHTN